MRLILRGFYGASERERLIREHYGREYRQELRRLMALGVTDEDEEE